jgi:signal transduction histidine kinase
MATSHSPRKPTFLWQAMLILLPVLVLAGVGGVSLRVEQKASEQDARKRAQENTAAFSRVLKDALTEELTRYTQLQKRWTSEIRMPTLPGKSIEPNNADLLKEISKWDQDFAALVGGSCTQLFVPDGVVLTNGELHTPPGRLALPTPPQWFCDLSPEQRSLWEALRSAQASHDASPDALKQAQARFVASGGSSLAAASLLNPFDHQAPLRDSELSESGVSFRDAECLKLLRDPNCVPDRALLDSVWRSLFESPSFLSPMLVDFTDAAFPRMNPSEQAHGNRMRLLWDAESRSRRWMEALAQQPVIYEWEPPQLRSCWLLDDDGAAFALLNPGRTATASNQMFYAYFCSVIPESVMTAIIKRSAGGYDFLIPAYVRVNISVQGHRLFGDGFTSGEESLALSTQKSDKGGMPGLGELTAEFILMDRNLMLSSERRRSDLFLALLVAAVGVAVAGVIAAHRAFRREQLLNTQKSNFVSSVSHELRAPIASVRLMAESLERGNVTEPAKQREYFRFIGQECRRLSALIANVLDFARIEQGRKQYEFEPTDLTKLVDATVKLMEPYAAEKGVKLELNAEYGTRNAEWGDGRTSNIQHSTPNSQGGENAATENLQPATCNLELTVDGHAIQQALVNLIDNAIKHSAAGQAVTVSLETRNAERGTRNEAPGTCNLQRATFNLSVSDSGPGIPASEREKIFERFYRLGSELRRETQGIGIGLSIVKHIVEAHDGRVIVESEVGQGSKFTIELPGKNSTTDGHG